MPKRAASTRLEQELMTRIERIAKVDRRTVANVIEICVAEYLPRLEQEISDKKAAILHEEAPPYKTAVGASSSKHAKKVA